MTRAWIGAFVGLVMAVSACGSDDGGGGDGTGDSTGSGSSTSTSSTSLTTTTTTTTSTSGTSADGTDSSGADTGSGDAGTDGSTGGSTGSADTSATEGTGTGDGSTSGGVTPDDYPMCMADEDCSDPYTLCWPPMDFGTPNFCTLECADAGECPVPSTGAAVPVCEGPPGTDVCVLDCTDGECPDGMTCIDVFGDGNFMRCSWA